MENSREGWKNRGSDGSRGDQGSRVLFERFRPPHDTVLKRYRVATVSPRDPRHTLDACANVYRVLVARRWGGNCTAYAHYGVTVTDPEASTSVGKS